MSGSTATRVTLRREGNSSRALPDWTLLRISIGDDDARSASVVEPPAVGPTGRAAYLVKDCRFAQNEGVQDAGLILACYRDRGAAELHADRLRREAIQQWLDRPRVSPEMTWLPEEVFRDALCDLGIDPPNEWEARRRHWHGWWERVGGSVSAWQLTGLLAVLDRLGPYRVVEVPLVG